MERNAPAAPAVTIRPEIPPQTFENIDSAPGNPNRGAASPDVVQSLSNLVLERVEGRSGSCRRVRIRKPLLRAAPALSRLDGADRDSGPPIRLSIPLWRSCWGHGSQVGIEF